MKFKRLSRQQLKVMSWWGDNSPVKDRDAIICDGAIRSGKTVMMAISFILWSINKFNNEQFALCGKTIGACNRNVITPLIRILDSLGFSVDYKRSRGYLNISKGEIENRYFVFGGRDEKSQDLIQGMTLAGVLFDEVALMPRSFVEQALARCSVEGSKFWFNCNPEHPLHWFYKEWICKPKTKNTLYLHFTMEDNPSLTDEIKERYRRLYDGVFYLRFILGRWVVAQGLVYPMFNKAQHVVKEIPNERSEYYISMDYGTVNPTSMGLWKLQKGIAYREKEYYHSSKATGKILTDEEYYVELEKLIDGKPIEYIVVDPSAASFIQTIRRHGRYSVIPANNDVLNGIRKVSSLLKSDMIKIHDCCKDTIKEFSLYRWDEKKPDDQVIKDNDHAMDDIRYFVNTVLSREFRYQSWFTAVER